MITLEQHLAEHALYYNEDEWKTSPWVCKCKWTPTFDPDDEFFEGLDDDSITGQHAAHVAATWREARTVRTVEELDALPAGSAIRSGECLMVMDRDKMWAPVWNGGPTSDSFLVLWTPEGGAA